MYDQWFYLFIDTHSVRPLQTCNIYFQTQHTCKCCSITSNGSVIIHNYSYRHPPSCYRIMTVGNLFHDAESVLEA